jgi:acetolactate synthase-1/2/3 large subunit
MIKVSDYLARRLYELGARHVFMITGGGAMHLNNSFARSVPYDVLYQHHEQACSIAAEGLFRATGKIGVVNVTTGPGGLNALTGVLGQWTDSIPAIYVSGQVKYSTTVACCRAIPLRQLGDQEVDILPVVSPLVKYATSVIDPRDVRLEVEKAFHIATTGRMGPVWIDVPMNVQGSLVDEGVLKPFVPPTDLGTPSADLRQVVELLKSARRPVLVAGHGIRLARCLPTLDELVNRLQIPVLATFNGFDLIPSDHPCQCGRIGSVGTRAGNFTLQNSDLVLLLGTRNNIRQVTYNSENFACHAVTVAVDVDEAELHKPTFKPNHPIHADLCQFLPALVAELEATDLPDRSEWLAWARERTRLHPVVQPAHRHQHDRIHPYAFMERFTLGLPEGATVVAGNGTACVVLFQAGIVKKGQRIFWNSGCAAMGYDLPAAIGAALGTGAETWCLAGDGSLQMNLQELATLAHRRLPVNLVVLDNGGYASIRQTQATFFGAKFGCTTDSGLGFPALDRIAEAYGLPYRRTSRLADVEADQSRVKALTGPVLWHVEMAHDYAFEPKVSSEKLPDGRIISKQLEDMAPFLPRDVFARDMPDW